MNSLRSLKRVRPVGPIPPRAGEESSWGNRSVQPENHFQTGASPVDPPQAPFDCGPPIRPVRSNGSGNWSEIFTSDTFQADISRNNFDIIRLCLAFLVIYSHSYPLLGYGLKEPLFVLSGRQCILGELAVTAFFMISGFLITRSWNGSRSFQSYIEKRVCRIYPGFLVASLLCLFIVGPLGASNRFNYWREIHPFSFAANLLLLQPQFPRSFQNLAINHVNGSLWSIPWEFYCYLAIPVAAFLGCIRRRGWLLALFIVSMVLLVAKIQFVPKLPFPGKIATAFMSGQVFYLYSDVIRYKKPILIVSLLLLLFSAVASNLHLFHIFLPLFGSYILFYIAFVPSRTLAFAKSLTKGNDLSYGVYLYGWPVQQLIVQAYQRHLTPLSLFVLAMLGSTVLGGFSWFLVERRFLARRTERKVSAAQVAYPAPATFPGSPSKAFES
jgi:peptidoglycan/LPS O-acetylase OafA/YrhL